MRFATRHLDGPPPDAPTTWFRGLRRELNAVGLAVRIAVPAPWPEHLVAVAASLATFDIDDEVGVAGCGPVAFASLPFDPTASGTLLLPSVVWGATPDGERWITTADGADPGPLADHREVPRSVRLECPVSPDAWMGAVAAATQRIRAGELDKVVLAREILAHADVDWPVTTIGERLAAMHPHALRFCVDGHVGASPELLVSRIGDMVRAQPMAGTTRRTGDAAIDQQLAAELLASTKNRSEHQITIDTLHDVLLGWCSYLDAEPHPSVVAAGSVQHLATLVEGRLYRPAPSVAALVSALHPTPAVGGRPTDAALRLIAELEGVDRRRYAGPVGWIDAAGNGAWAVGLRGVEFEGPLARVRAGNGMVADSDPAAELEETRAKFAATLGALTRL